MLRNKTIKSLLTNMALKKSVLLQFNSNQVEEVRKLFNYNNSLRLEQDVDAFQEWIRKQNHFRIKEFDRDYLERYLIYNKGFIERAKKHFDRVCTLRNLMPDFLRNFDIRNEFQPLLHSLALGIMSKPTEDNYRVVMMRVEDNHERVELIHLYRYVIVCSEYILCHDYCAGFEVLADLRYIPIGWVAKVNPVVVSKAVTIIIEAMGMRVKKFHFLSGSKFFDVVIAIAKRGLSDKIAARIVIHDSIQSIHEYMDKDILPVEYGGKEKSLKELNELLYQEMSSDSHVARIKHLEAASTDETCRLAVTFNEEYSGMPGSFKSLCVD